MCMRIVMIMLLFVACTIGGAFANCHGEYHWEVDTCDVLLTSFMRCMWKQFDQQFFVLLHLGGPMAPLWRVPEPEPEPEPKRRCPRRTLGHLSANSMCGQLQQLPPPSPQGTYCNVECIQCSAPRFLGICPSCGLEPF